MIEQLLSELYEADPSLASKETILRPLLSELLTDKPDATMNPAVRAGIKKSILEHVSGPVEPAGMLAGNMWSYLRYIGAFAMLILLVVVLRQPKVQLAFVPEVSTTSDRAFGPLTMTNTEDSAMQSVSLKITTPPESFIYNGPLDLSVGDVPVLRRDDENLSPDALTGLVESFALKPAYDAQQVGEPASASVNLSQDTEFGYDVAIDFSKGEVSIMQNPAQWPAQPSDEVSEVLTGDEVISIADAFLGEHDITTQGYGEAVVIDDTTVVYPMIVDNTPVYEENGAPYGVQVTVDAQTRRVATVDNLATRRYTSSPYEGVQDDVVLHSALTNGGWRSTSPGTMKANLNSPVRAWMHTWISDSAGNASELLVPALVFQLSSVSQDSTIAPSPVVLPLASELYPR